MYDVLKGMRVVEGASFIAGPICCQHLLQLGADVIRFDMIGGGPDYSRWPVTATGASLYWEGLNKGKKSIAIDLSSERGRDLAVRIATAPGDDAGLFVTNYPVEGFLSHERLAARRSDMITVRVMGWADGRNGVDYTVNAVTGLPAMTGPTGLPQDQPVNHVLPAWDLITGSYAAFSLMAAERQRRLTGQGAEVRVPLSDVAATSLGHTGQIAEVVVGADRPRLGNDLFGALGRDFVTADGRRVMIVAITGKQWSSVVEALEIGAQVSAIEAELGVAFAHEGQRYHHRARLFELMQAAIARLSLADAAGVLEKAGVCWSVYRKLSETISEERGFIRDNPVFAEQRHPAGFAYPTPGAAATFAGLGRAPAPRAPRLGEHTDEVLAEVLGLSTAEIARLHDDGIVAGPHS
ncbi:CoA transferase [Mesorhizobium sp. L-8-3]|uniref:CoA transferase n=1 Tax=Mesorhizobium sp. L-8-3 TaxID=2744522 RepID=UPI0019272148|nr:CoA transferase [Mesorhizobium sp. L-8-3]BCH25462.1 2-methylfumaryl-CoA isomerase [Mesorhizobium sp. L-8-3]